MYQGFWDTIDGRTIKIIPLPKSETYMGSFCYVCGELKCIHCNTIQDACFSTKLLSANAHNNSKEYRQGDLVIIDGLGDYCAIRAWQPGEILRVVMGDWECGACDLNYQWALVAFRRMENHNDFLEGFPARIDNIQTFVPVSIESFADIHFVERELADLAAFTMSGPV